MAAATLEPPDRARADQDFVRGEVAFDRFAIIASPAAVDSVDHDFDGVDVVMRHGAAFSPLALDECAGEGGHSAHPIDQCAADAGDAPRGCAQPSLRGRGKRIVTRCIPGRTRTLALGSVTPYNPYFPGELARAERQALLPATR